VRLCFFQKGEWRGWSGEDVTGFLSLSPLPHSHSDRSIAPGIDGEYKFVVPGAAQALKFRAPLCKAEQVQYMKEGGPTRAELGLSTDAHVCDYRTYLF